MKFQNVNGRRYFEQEEKDWLVKNYPILGRNEATKQFNKIFNHNKSASTLGRYCNHWLGIHISENARQRRYEKHRAKVGDVYKNCRGVWMVKTDDGWIQLSHALKDVPKGYIAFHLDGNPDNNDPENIEVIKNGIQTIARNENLISENPEITRTALRYAELYSCLKKSGFDMKKENRE